VKNGSPDSPKVDLKPVAPHMYLAGSAMGVLWAIVATVLWAGLAVAFGRSKSNGRLLTMLVLGAVVVAFLCAHSYREGWKSRHNRGH
jgi:drug/metabolite transporter (DMT)-like permease